MQNCPAESRLRSIVPLRRSQEEGARYCSQRSPKFLFAGISCEGDLHTSLGSLVDEKYVIGKGVKKFNFSGCMVAADGGAEPTSPFASTPSLRVCHEANKMRRRYFESTLSALPEGHQ